MAKAIVDDAVNQITSTLENPTSKELKNALVANIQESLKNEEINPQLLEKITEELDNKINILKQEHEITAQFNHWMQPSIPEKPLSPHLRALTEGRFLPTQTAPHSPLGNKVDAFERSMNLGLKNKQPLQKEPISKEIKDEMDKGSDGADPDIDPMIFEKILELPDFEYIIKKSSEKTLEEFSASPLIGEHVFPLDPLLENFTSQTAVYERLFEDSTFQQVVYERLPAFVPISEKEEALPATSFFSDKSVHSVKTSETLIRGFEGAHATFLDLALEGKMPETLEETKEILWKEKNLTAAEHDHFYQGIMDDEAVEKLLAAYDPGYVVMHHHPEKEDIVFSYKEQNGNITEFFVGEDSVEIVMDKLIKDGKLFILNPEKEKLFKEVEKNSYYHGVMDDKAVDAILEVFDPGYVVMHHHPEKEDIVF
ncbi:MAG TPA: hypothetical protein PLC42_04200, partial [Parachlamydiaceae bacterium]|nr:hypothetical protein [Parachlamydiaceae bacterium]